MADTTEFILRAIDEFSATFDSLNSHLDRARKGISEIARIGAGNLIGTLGFEAFNEAIGGVEKFGASLITSNSNAEVFRNTLQGLYGSATEAANAFNYLQANEMKVPFNIEDIQKAATTVVGFGGDITQVMTPLEAMASEMGVTLPTAAQALMDAHSNLWRMMNRDLHVTKEELASTGMVSVDAAGHVTGDLDAAFAAYVAKRYPDALNLQMQTLKGSLSSLGSQFTYLSREMGAGVFAVVKTQVQDLTREMQTNSGQIAAYAAVFSRGLGDIAQGAFDAARRIGQDLPEAILVVSNSWKLLSGPAGGIFDTVSKDINAFLSWFIGTILPVLETSIGRMVIFWENHATEVSTVLRSLADYVTKNGASLMEALNGIFQMGFAAVSAVVGGALDLMAGNWDKFVADTEGAFNLLLKGAVEVVSGMAQAMVPIVEGMIGPYNTLMHGIHDVWMGIGGFIASMLGDVAHVAQMIESQVIGVIDSLIGKFNSLAGALHLPQIPEITDPYAKPKGFIGPWLPRDLGAESTANAKAWLTQHDPGIGADKQVTWGRTEAQAKADIQAEADKLIKQYGLDATPAKAPTYDGAQKRGADLVSQFDAMIEGLFKGKLNLPAGKNAALPGYNGTLPSGAGDNATTAKEQQALLKTAFSDALEKFRADEGSGASLGKMLQDIFTVLKDDKASGASAAALQVEQQTLMKDLLATENARFSFDQTHGATQAALLADIKNVALADKAAGYSPAAIAADVKRLTDSMLKAVSGTSGAAARSALGFGNPQPGLGDFTSAYMQSSFRLAGAGGGNSQVLLLERQLAVAERQIAQDDRIIAGLQAVVSAVKSIGAGVRAGAGSVRTNPATGSGRGMFAEGGR